MRPVPTTCPVGAAFVAAGLVTADRWVAEAAAGGSAVELVARLSRGHSGEVSGPVVTAYHARLVARLATEGSLDRLPQRLRMGRFVVLSELGRGGMGVVYLGWDGADQKLVALKRVRAAARELQLRFQREARVLARLDHPGIARFHQTETVGTAEVLVMEYVPGLSASRVVRRLAKQGRALPCETAVHWVTQTLAALGHAHDRHVVHRDIKPGNLMVMPNGRQVKLLDMGLAKCLNEPTEQGALTECGQAVGTREYMPPEQWLGAEEVTPAADLYALGCTLFSLLAGRPPFEGGSTYKLMNQHLHAPVPPLRAERPDVPLALDEVVQRLTAKNPAHRGTAREISWLLTHRVRCTATSAGPAPARPARLPAPRAPSSTSRSVPGTAPGSAPTAREKRTLLSGTGLVDLASEWAAEAKRLIAAGVGGSAANPHGGPSRLKEISRELVGSLWDGLRGRRPDTARAAWSLLGALIVFVCALVWAL